jgi:hypothetical protein
LSKKIILSLVSIKKSLDAAKTEVSLDMLKSQQKFSMIILIVWPMSKICFGWMSWKSWENLKVPMDLSSLSWWTYWIKQKKRMEIVRCWSLK